MNSFNLKTTVKSVILQAFSSFLNNSIKVHFLPAGDPDCPY